MTTLSCRSSRSFPSQKHTSSPIHIRKARHLRHLLIVIFFTFIWTETAPATPLVPTVLVKWNLDDTSRKSIELGRKVTVRLEVWSSTWFQAPVEFPNSLKSDTVLVEVAGGSPESKFTEWQQQRWTVLSRRYFLQPIQTGEHLIELASAMEIQPGAGEGRIFQVWPEQPLRFQVKRPTGSETLEPFVAASHLELHERWVPHPDLKEQWHVGNLIERQVWIESDDIFMPMPAIELQSSTPDLHVRIQKSPESSQSSGRISKKITYQLKKYGSVEIPPIFIRWWDTKEKKIRISKLPGISLNVQREASRPDPFTEAPTINTHTKEWNKQYITIAGSTVFGIILTALVLIRNRRPPKTQLFSAIKKNLTTLKNKAWPDSNLPELAPSKATNKTSYPQSRN